MANRFRGKLDIAKSEYSSILDGVRGLAAEQGGISTVVSRPLYAQKLSERVYNTAERLADCELYSGAASRPAGVDLDQACVLYQTAHDAATDDVSRISMGFKLAIARALKDQVDDADDAIQAAKERLATTNPEIDRMRVDLLRRTADAVLSWKMSGAAGARDKTQAILRDLYSADRESQERVRSEIMELYLFNAELLIAASFDDEMHTLQGGELDYLTLLLSRFPSALELAPYLRRYYEVAVEAAIESDEANAARLAIYSRHLKPEPQVTTCIFFLPDYWVQQCRNVALLLSPDSDPLVYPLAFGRQDILNPAARTSPFPLPPELRRELTGAGAEIEDWELRLPDDLVARITELQRMGEPCYVSWSDVNCWPAGSDEALTSASWPFEKQLPEARLMLAPARQ
jgi:hypothetical protein